MRAIIEAENGVNYVKNNIRSMKEFMNELEKKYIVVKKTYLNNTNECMLSVSKIVTIEMRED